MPEGLDTPVDAGSALDAIKAAGLDFVARYYRSPTSHWPSLSASEAKLISQAGLFMVAVWEAASTKPSYFNRLSGLDDATSAYRQAKAIGQPPGSAIYFAVDYDASGTDIVGPINEYFRGVHDGFNAAGGGNSDYRVGVYGSGAVCQGLLAAYLADYTWLAQSSGWSGFRQFLGWNIKQGTSLPTIPIDNDSDTAAGDFGSFTVSV